MVSPDSGSNPTDDEGPATLQDNPDNLTRAEIAAEIEDLEPDQQAELVALMWIGRGDMEPEEWEEARELAAERHEGRRRPTCSPTRTSPTTCRGARPAARRVRPDGDRRVLSRGRLKDSARSSSQE